MEEIKQQIKKYIISNGHTQVEADTVKIFQPIGADVIYFSFGIGAKKFISNVLIEELKAVVRTSPWLAFVLIGSGIEFLGKCIDTKYPTDWDKQGRSEHNFKAAIRELNGLNKYTFLLDRSGFNLYSKFRCGLTHGLAPKSGISLSSKAGESPNLFETNGTVNFHINSLYEDFKTACEDVISRTYPEPNKMNEARMFINGTYSVPTHTSFTSSFDPNK